jgi:hypothetical protein
MPPQKRPAATLPAEPKPKAKGKPVPPTWPPWIHRTAETLERGRAQLPPGAQVPEDHLPDLPSSLQGPVPFTKRLKQHLLYRYSERAVRAASFRPERFTEYCLGRPVQVADVHVSCRREPCVQACV